MIDNFDLIKTLFYFDENTNLFFHCFITQRGKDGKPNKLIQTYLIRSAKHLESLKKEITLLSEHYQARAYINVAGKSFEKVNKAKLITLANEVCSYNDCFINPEKLLGSTAGEVKSESPRWIIDIDDISIKDQVIEWLDKYFHIEEPPHFHYRNFYLKATVPTVHGCHLIVTPFNSLDFNKKFPDVTILKNNGTLLYYPASLESPKYCCSRCGGTNIQLSAWVNSITHEFIEINKKECWCNDCLDVTNTKLING